MKPLALTSADPKADGDLVGEGYRVIRTFAPPVYDPGGAVGFVEHFAAAVSLRDAERVASADGLVLLIAPLDGADPKDGILDENGFTVASQFYVGVPR